MSVNAVRSTAKTVVSGRLTNLVEKVNLSYGSALACLAIGVLGYTAALPAGPLVTAAMVVTTFEFIRRLDVGLPLLQITALLAVLQWLVGPTITYFTGMTLSRYRMYVPEPDYYAYAIPGTMNFCAGLYVFGATIRQKYVLRLLDRRHFVEFGLLLNAVGIFAIFAAPRAPGGAQFLLFLLSQLKYVGAIYFLLSRHQYRYVFAGLSCLQLVTTSAESGLFHQLIIWLMLISTYWFAQYSLEFLQKLFVIGVAFAGVFVIQVVKQDFREKRDRGVATSVVSELFLVVGGQRSLVERDVLALASVRLNQGWIISAVMRHVPEGEPYAKGKTVQDALVASFLPRFLAPNKRRAGGQEYFRRFTGMPIAEGTSMGISPLGEAYANYGPNGGVVFMAVYGLAFGCLFRLTVRSVAKRPDFAFWLPLIFYQGIKAETEISVVLNQVSKGALVAYLGYYGLTQHVYPAIFGKPYRILRE